MRRFAKDFKERYLIGKRIGAGSFGTVYVATDTTTGEE